MHVLPAGGIRSASTTGERPQKEVREGAGDFEEEADRSEAESGIEAPLMDRDGFERIVASALASIPSRFRKAMANLVIAVEDEPSRQLLREMDIGPGDTLFGLYQGTPLTERQWDYGNTLPDRILLFQGPLERESEDEEDLVVAIGETLIHEVGHYFGLSEEEIEAIEEQYWRGQPDEAES